eukprot:1144349-Pelagomonas_calceolata.AAC.3
MPRRRWVNGHGLHRSAAANREQKPTWVAGSISPCLLVRHECAAAIVEDSQDACLISNQGKQHAKK